MFTPWVYSDVIHPEQNYDVEFNYGYGWIIKKDIDYSKNFTITLDIVAGGINGYFCFMVRNPTINHSLIYLFNMENFDFDLNAMFQGVGEKLTTLQ